MGRGWVYLCAAAALLLMGARPADADLVMFTTGRTLSVASHRVDGETIVLALRGGGEMRCPQSLVARILPDEVPRTAEEPVDRVAREATLGSVSLLPDTPYVDVIRRAAEAHGMDPVLVHAVIQVESAYRPTARSRKGAMGLMQLMPATARQYKVANPYDPATNIAAGVQHLRALLDRWGGIELALAAYNAGEGAVSRFNGIPPFQETQHYVARVLALAGRH